MKRWEVETDVFGYDQDWVEADYAGHVREADEAGVDALTFPAWLATQRSDYHDAHGIWVKELA